MYVCYMYFNKDQSIMMKQAELCLYSLKKKTSDSSFSKRDSDAADDEMSRTIQALCLGMFLQVSETMATLSDIDGDIASVLTQVEV